MAEADARLPIHILTGFLGTGKTTVLRHLLCDSAFADTAVLINEFGAVALDHLLVGALDAAPVLLPSGCLCCTVRGDVSAALRDLHDRRRRGEVPPFRRVIIETTGLADPTPLLATITADLVIRRHFRPGRIAATLDALHAEHGLAEHEEIGRQVGIADRLIITKIDLATPEQIGRLRDLLHALNPAAPLCEAINGAVQPDFLIGEDEATDATRLAEARLWMAPAAPVRHHPALNAFCLALDGKLDWSLFGLWFSLLVHRHGARLLRVKALLDVQGSATPVALHAVQHLIHPPEHLPDWPTEARGSRIVFITWGLEEAAVARSLRSFRGLADRRAREQLHNAFSSRS